MQSTVNVHEFTQQAIRALLDGGDGAASTAVPLSTFGPWAETVRLLLEAHAEGGTPAVVAVYRSLVRVNTAFGELMRAEESRQRRWNMRYLLHARRRSPSSSSPALCPWASPTWRAGPRSASRGW